MAEDNPSPGEALGESDAFLNFQERLSQIARVDRPVLIVGERGTGKELAASRLHYLSRRWQGPFIELNCAALASGLLESELFGHEAGAFTGAARKRTGRFEAAEGGTLFLDEIGLIPMEVQEKIMRVVEYRSFERVGSSSPTHVDVRIIGATNADLPAMAAEGKFKPDLLDRLSFEVLYLPPLRERSGDIMLLARHFAARMALELEYEGVAEFSDNAVEKLERHDWPGNVRELKNVVERAVYRSLGNTIDEVNFDPFRSPYSPPPREPVAEPARNQVEERRVDFNLGFESLSDAVADLERKALKQALENTQYHQGKAAELLGLSYHQFRGLYKKHKSELNQAYSLKEEQ